MMTPGKLVAFLKRWRDLETRTRDLDIERARWARDVRDEFADGTAGDHAFLNWLDVELGIPLREAESMLAQASCVRIVPDAKTWSDLGGFKQIRPLTELATRERATVLEAAKTQSKRITTVINERRKAQNPQPIVERKPTDVEILAEYVMTLQNVPAFVRGIATRHTRARARKVA